MTILNMIVTHSVWSGLGTREGGREGGRDKLAEGNAWATHGSSGVVLLLFEVFFTTPRGSPSLVSRHSSATQETGLFVGGACACRAPASNINAYLRLSIVLALSLSLSLSLPLGLARAHRVTITSLLLHLIHHGPGIQPELKGILRRTGLSYF